MKKLAIACTTFALSGCVTFPANEHALAAEGKKATPICSNLPVEKITQDVADYLGECFRWRPDIYVNGANVTTNFYSSKHATPNGTRFLIAMPYRKGLGYLLSVDVEKGKDACATAINGYAYNFMWERHFSRMETIAKGEKASCPF